MYMSCTILKFAATKDGNWLGTVAPNSSRKHKNFINMSTMVMTVVLMCSTNTITKSKQNRSCSSF